MVIQAEKNIFIQRIPYHKMVTYPF